MEVLPEVKNIRITGKPLPGTNSCTFTVDQPLLPNGSVYCPDRNQTKGSALLSTLFSISGVEAIWVNHNQITLLKSPSSEWRGIGKSLGDLVRALLERNEALFSSDFLLEQVEFENKPELSGEDEVAEVQIQELIETHINPGLSAHGGKVELLEVKAGVADLRMSGGCQGCGMAAVTLREGIEKTIKSKIPYIKEIRDVTDHDSGTKPYFARQV